MNYLLDTNILLNIVRARDYDGILDFLNLNDTLIDISIVTEAEIRSIGYRKRWSNFRLSLLDHFLSRVNIVEVNQLLINCYTDIDAYSQRENPNFTNYSFNTPRTMGKNDL